jgi:hypothetical protein
MQRRDLVPPLWLVTVGLGFAFGVYFVVTSPFAGDRLWFAWAPLVVAYTAAAGAVFPYGIARWAELTGSGGVSVRVRDAAIRVAPIAACGLFVLVWSPWLPAPVHFPWRTAAFVASPLVGGVTAAGVMEGIRLAAGHQPVTGTRGEQAALVVRLRQLLQRLLLALGSLVALSTFVVGASVNLLRGPAKGPGLQLGPLPPQVVLVFGGVGTLVVALYYVPAATALQRRGQRLCDDLFPLAKADEATAVLAAAEDHRKLGQLLGADRSITTDMQTNLAILGPLLISAATALLAP